MPDVIEHLREVNDSWECWRTC